LIWPWPIAFGVSMTGDRGPVFAEFESCRFIEISVKRDTRSHSPLDAFRLLEELEKKAAFQRLSKSARGSSNVPFPLLMSPSILDHAD
jgi:hypothetical protein